MKETRDTREEGIKQYEEVMKKAGLPSLKEFEEEFECRINAPAITFIFSVLLDKLGQCGSHIEILFQPVRMADAIESKFHSEQEKKKLFEHYKKIISIVHEAHASMFTDRDARIRMINKLYDFYMKEAKTAMKKYLEAQAKSWLSEEKTEQGGQYFG